MHDEVRKAEILALLRRDFNTATAKAQSTLIKNTFGSLYTGVLDILQRHDPIGVGLIALDEYSPETDTIVLRLHEAKSVASLRRIIWEEFVWWFSNSGDWEQKLADNDAGPEENYTEIAREIWDLWAEPRLLEREEPRG
jgi:hypothetical protein